MARLAALAPLLLVGCVAPPASGEAYVELGTGSWRFEEVLDGQTAELVRGAQGGWHVWLSVRAHNVPVERVRLVIETQAADETGAPQRTDVEIDLGEADEEGQRTLLGWPAVIAEPQCLVGQMVRLTIHLRTEGGEELTDERYVILGGGADPPDACP